MIALKHNRPLLQSRACVFSDYDVEWIESVLLDAQNRAGVYLACLRELASGIIMYIEQSCELRVLPLDYLFTRMREVLAEMGLPLIAQNIQNQTPPIELSLRAVAEKSPLPLFFYSELQRQLGDLKRKGLHHYRFVDINHCALTLSARSRQCPTTRRMREELEAFLSEAVA